MITITLFLQIVSVLAFLMSLYNFTVNILHSKFNVDLEILFYNKGSGKGNLRVCFIATNNSMKSVSITRIQLIHKNELIEVVNTPIMLEGYIERNGSFSLENKIENTLMPVNLSPLQCSRIEARFKGDRATYKDLDTHMTLKVSTNRGAKTMSLLLPTQEYFPEKEYAEIASGI